MLMKKQNLSLKKCYKTFQGKITLQKNPFIVNHWFNILEETVKKLGIEDRPDLICNSDESGLPSEPKKCKVNSLKGKLYKL